MNLASHWCLDPSVVYLNHGSFGACPSAVLDAQAALRLEMEREPVDFLVAKLPARLDAARETLASFLGAAPSDLVFVSNATAGVNAVLRSLTLQAGDELLLTNLSYAACRKTADFVALDAVASEQRLRVSESTANERQFPGKIDRILHAGVHALPAGGAVDMGGVASEEHPPVAIVSNDPLIDPEGGEPNRRGRLCDDLPERIILGNLHREHTSAARLERPPSPEDHAARIGIAGRDAFRIKVAPLMPTGG